MAQALIQADNLQIKQEADTAKLSLDILPGTITSIVGMSADDNIQWLKTLAGLTETYYGELYLKGQSLESMGRQDWLNSRRNIAYIGNDISLLSALNIINNIIMPAFYHKQGKREKLESKAYELCAKIGLNDSGILKKLPAYINTEQHYLTLFARAMLLKPKALFIDSMFSRISIANKKNILDYLQLEVEQNQLSIIIHTRNIEFSCNYADNILFIDPENIYKFANRDDFMMSKIPSVSHFLQTYRSKL